MVGKMFKCKIMRRILSTVIALAVFLSIVPIYSIPVKAEPTNLIDIALFGQEGFSPFYATDGSKPINVSTSTGSYPTAVAEGLEIVPNSGSKSGGAFITKKVSSSDDFALSFSVKTHGRGSYDSADGFCFIIAANATSIGQAGGALGYGGITNSIAIEFDTFGNPDMGDAGECGSHVHTDLRTNGIMTGDTGYCTSLGKTFKEWADEQEADGKYHITYFWAEYNSQIKRLEVRISINDKTRPENPTFVAENLNIGEIVGNECNLGIVSSTGGGWQQVVLTSLYYSSGTTEPIDLTKTYSSKKINSCAHASKTHVEAKAATCAKTGNVEHWVCDTCGNTFDENGNEINILLKRTDHSWTYVAGTGTDSDKLYAYCTNGEACTFEPSKALSLTLSPSSPTYSGDGVVTGWDLGEDVAFTLGGADMWGTVLGSSAVPQIMYDGTGETSYSSTTPPIESGTYTTSATVGTEVARAAFEIKEDSSQHKITYDLVGGTINGNTTDYRYTHNGKYTFSSDPVRNNDLFLGWYTGKMAGSQVDTNTDYIEGVDTLYAHWASGIDLSYVSGKSGDEGAAKLIDNNLGTKWGAESWYRTFEFKTTDSGKYVITYMKLWSSKDNVGCPNRHWKAWTLYGQNSSGNWEVIKQWQDQPLATGAKVESSYPLLENTQAYSNYKLTIDDGHGDGYLEMGEMKLYGYTSHNWQYSLEETNKLSAHCATSGHYCDDASIILSVKPAAISGSTYDGVTIKDVNGNLISSEENQWLLSGLLTPIVEYSLDGSNWSTSAPSTAGNYTVRVYPNGATPTVTNTLTANFELIDHTHSWQYSASDNTLEAYCNNGVCPSGSSLTDKVVLTVSASSPTYSGSTPTITIGTDAEKTAWTEAEATVPTTVSYEKADGTALASAPSVAGSYVAKVSPVGETATDTNTAKVSFTISKLEPTATAPTAVAGLIYDGTEQVLVTAGNTSNGNLQYALAGDGAYSADLPVATNAGTYNVYYKVVGDSEHTDKVFDSPVSVTIAKATYSGTTTASGDILAGYSSSNIEVTLPTIPEHMEYTTPVYSTPVTSATVSDGKVTYNANNSATASTNYTITIPVAEKTGEHSNYNDYNVTVTLTGYDCTHTSTTVVAKKNPTCTEDGMEAYDLCSICGTKLVGGVVKTDTELTIYKLNHSWGYTANGATLIATCANDTSHTVELTLTVTSPTYSDSAVYSASLDTTAWTEAGFTVPEIKYFKTTTKNVVTGGDSVTNLTGLGAGYYYAKITAGEGADTASAVAAFEVKKASQEAPIETTETIIGYAINYIYETIVTTDPAYELSMSNGEDVVAIDDDKAVPGSTYYIRKKGNDNYAPSAWTTITVSVRPAAPTGCAPVNTTAVNGTDGKITGVTDVLEYSTDNGTTWTSVTGTEIPNLSRGKVLVRVKATQTSFAGESVEITVSDPHVHQWTVTTSGDKVIATSTCHTDTTCGFGGTKTKHELTLTVTTPIYNGNTPTYTVGTEIEKDAWEAAGAPVITVSSPEYYSEDNKLDDVPNTPGTYTIKLTVNGKSIEAELVIKAAKNAEDEKAANDVINKINEIKPVVLTDDSKKKVDDAREAYEKLTDDQKKLVDNYKDLEEAEKEYDDLKKADEERKQEEAAKKELADNKDKFEQYKEDKKSDIDKTATDDDSDECKSIIEAAKKSIDDLKYDEQKTLDENKNAVDLVEEKFTEDINERRAYERGLLETRVDVDPELPLEEIKAGFNNEEIIESEGVFTAEEKEAMATGTDAKVWLEVKPIGDTEVNEQTKTKFVDIVQDAIDSFTNTNPVENESDIFYLDASLYKQVGDATASVVHEPGITIDITFKLPSTMINNNPNIERTYIVIREHNGVAEKLICTFNPETGEITFATDRFSTYALVYVDQIVTIDEHTVHVAGVDWIYDRQLGHNGESLRHKECIYCGKSMNYETVDRMINYEIPNNSSDRGTTSGTSGTTGATTGNSSGSRTYEIVDYTVVSGDWMINIANRYGMTLEELAADNSQIKNLNLIYPGNTIKIRKYSSTGIAGNNSPAAGSTINDSNNSASIDKNGESTVREVTQYTVEEGDWLIAIASAHNMTLDEVLELNNVENPDLIYPGNVINVYSVQTVNIGH